MTDKLLIDLIAEDSSTATTAVSTASTSTSKRKTDQIVVVSLDTLLLDLLVPQSQVKAVSRIVDPLNASLLRGIKSVPIVLPIGLLDLNPQDFLVFLKSLTVPVPDKAVTLPYCVEYKGKEVALDSKSLAILINKTIKPTKILAKTVLLANKLSTIGKFDIKANLSLAHLLASPLNTLTAINK